MGVGREFIVSDIKEVGGHVADGWPTAGGVGGGVARDEEEGGGLHDRGQRPLGSVRRKKTAGSRVHPNA
jgi:hypothetical protein